MGYIGKNLRYLRQQAKLSQQNLARELGLNRGNIASYEKGGSEPNTANLLKITRFFGVDVVDFVEQDLSETNSNIVALKKNDSPQALEQLLTKPSLPELLEESRDHTRQEADSDLSKTATEVLAERTLALETIIKGMEQYYKMVKEKKDPKEILDPELNHDYLRLLGLSQELLDINRQLVRSLLVHAREKTLS
jgi:transcriptional regulator with XRE-family HTH domain